MTQLLLRLLLLLLLMLLVRRLLKLLLVLWVVFKMLCKVQQARLCSIEQRRLHQWSLSQLQVVQVLHIQEGAWRRDSTSIGQYMQWW